MAIGAAAKSTGPNARFRVLGFGDPQPDSPVAINHTCLGHPGPAEIREMAELGARILGMGGFAVAFVPKQGFSTTSLYVYDKPGKAPRADLDIDKLTRVLQWFETL